MRIAKSIWHTPVTVLTLMVITAAPAASAVDVLDEAVQTAIANGVEDDVAEQTVQQAADEAAAAAEEQIVSAVESEAASRVEEQVTHRVETGAVAAVEESTTEVVEASVTESVAHQVVDRVAAQAADTVVSEFDAPTEAQVRGVIERGALDQAVSGMPAAAQRPPGSAAAAAGPKEPQTAESVTGPFVTDVDPAGRPIEQDILVLLVPDRDLAAIRALGMTVQRQRALPGLGHTLIRLRVDPGVSLSQAASLVHQAATGTAVDYNHLYELDAAESSSATASGADVAQTSSATAPTLPEFSIGIIDSAVDASHPALASARIQQRDFVDGDSPRPSQHGTAIASILVQEGERVSGHQPKLFSAGVFFERAPGVVSSTTESIVAALGWLIEENVDVVNMSLTGPANELFELAVEEASRVGSRVVAAVGNNGPAGAPLYPAAYDAVIGITAVDRGERIFAYANRGRHVAFAAPGVGVRVASSGGGYAEQDGTSLASAHAAVMVAASLTRAAQAGLAELEVMDRLKANARDLGDRGFDETYGYGFIDPLDL